MVAVTGTAGKTSVAGFVRQIWAYAGKAAASIGTTGVVAPGRNDYGTLTTPDPVELHRLLKDLAHEGVTHASMEASSHGLDQHRLSGVTLKAAAFTNLGRDHLDYHPTIEDYLAAKLRLFDTLMEKGSPAVIFADDAFSKAVIDCAKAAELQVLTVGRNGTFIALKRVEHERRRQRAHVEHGGQLFEIDLPLAGDFQIANALVSAGLAIVTGVPAAVAFAALEHLEGAPGRLDLVGQNKEGALVYVDYAHKPEALENVLLAVRPFTTGRVIVVFGCGGDRDKGKRPIMGEIAVRLADVTIVTDDNPRSEVPAQIRAEIMAAAKGATEIGDRAKAIEAAVQMLKAGDTLIVAGKGHEEGQTIAGVTHHFSDHEEVRKALGMAKPSKVGA
jgi:UDP-N-acetylmuramoyl-L-alanyl-D-glutamate--2,6-diaminopimelate ligase